MGGTLLAAMALAWNATAAPLQAQGLSGVPARVHAQGLPLAQDASPARGTGLEALRERIRRGGVLTASFDTRYTDGFTSETSSRSGRLWLADGAYRVETDEQILVVNGRTSTVHDRAMNRVLISDYDPEEDDFAPSRFLEASEEMKETQSRSGRGTVVTLTSEDPYALWIEIRIELDARGLPVTIRGVDQGNNLIDTGLKGVSWLADRASSSAAGDRTDSRALFTLTPPPGAEVIDLRASTKADGAPSILARSSPVADASPVADTSPSDVRHPAAAIPVTTPW